MVSRETIQAVVDPMIKRARVPTPLQVILFGIIRISQVDLL